MKVQRYAFFGKPAQAPRDIREVPVFMRLSMVMLAAICVVGGILAMPACSRCFLGAARDVLLNGTGYANAVLEALR